MAIDLEHFPTNKTALRMMERISPVYDRSYVGKWIFEIMGMEMEEARVYFEELRQQPFPERATWAIPYWEQYYAITPKPTDDLETRRRNIIMKQGGRPPMNPARMEVLVSSLTGRKVTVTENTDDYTFSVDIDGTSPNVDMLSVIKEIKKRKPSHQSFDIITSFHSVVVENNTALIFHRMGLSSAFSHLRGSVVRWDGSVDYDGEILFDQASTGIRLPAMRFCIRLRELRSRSVRWDGSVLHDGTIDFGQQIGSGGSPSFGVRLRAPHALAASVPELRMGGGIAHPSFARVSRSVFAAPCARHEGHIGGAVTMDNWRGMDGGLSFDGTYKFDAYLKKEEL